jgi:malonyl-CoA O-methyltransferase
MLRGKRFDCILEIGCGTGKNTALLAQLAPRVLGLDLSSGMLAQARARGLGPRVAFAQADITRPWPVASESFDLVTFNLILEHVAKLAPIFAEAARALCPGGQVFVCELHPTRQYLGRRATFSRDGADVHPPAFTHHLCDFTRAAEDAKLKLVQFDEWWDDEDRQTPPRIVSFGFAS